MGTTNLCTSQKGKNEKSPSGNCSVSLLPLSFLTQACHEQSHILQNWAKSNTAHGKIELGLDWNFVSRALTKTVITLIKKPREVQCLLVSLSENPFCVIPVLAASRHRFWKPFTCDRDFSSEIFFTKWFTFRGKVSTSASSALWQTAELTGKPSHSWSK